MSLVEDYVDAGCSAMGQQEGEFGASEPLAPERDRGGWGFLTTLDGTGPGI